MEDSQVYLDGAQRLKNVIESQFGTLFTAYFLGRSQAIPDAALPCIVFQKVAGRVEIGPTMTDQLTEQVMIHILLSGKDGFGSPDDDDTVMRQLFTLVEGRDPQTGNFNTDSIMYAIRHNLTLSSTVINHTEEINYDVTPRPDQPTIVEAIIIVTISERVTVANRI